MTLCDDVLHSLAYNELRVEGCKAIMAVLDKTRITSLKCASHPIQRLSHGLCTAVLRLPNAQRRWPCTTDR